MPLAFIFDLGGTVYRGGAAIPGAAAFIRKLRDDGVPYLFVTNRGNRTPAHVAKQLTGMGIACTEDTVLTSAQATAKYLGAINAYVIGETGVLQALTDVGANVVEDNPDVVIVSYDTAINYDKLTKATRHVLAGARLIATDTDNIITVEDGVLPEAGPLVAAIENATGITAEVIGKPNRIIMDEASSRLKVANKDCIVVGDFLMTDILAAHNAGMASALILTGVSTREDIAAAPCNPIWVVENYIELEIDVYLPLTKH
ncbi:MAG: HAD-IIA family hydrolase [Paracoccaceae bacterium]